MIWDDPWIDVATQKGGSTIPPPPPTIPTGFTFRVSSCDSLNLDEWRRLVGTKWSNQELINRLKGSHIACLYSAGIAATCVLREMAPARQKPWWILETLVAREIRKGHGALLMRCVMTWMYRRSGPFILSYTWELTLLELAWAYCRGWLKSAVDIEYGWVLADTSSASTFVEPTWIYSNGGRACVTSSGLHDGYVFVYRYEGQPCWGTIAKKCGSLWMRSAHRPSLEWKWTGEFVVVGSLNGAPDCHDWITAEVAPGLNQETGGGDRG